MKYILAIIIAIISINSSYSQKIVKKDGQFLVEAGASNKIARDSTTKYQYKDSKGAIYPVYISTRGKYYYYKISGNTGLPYKVYLKVE